MSTTQLPSMLFDEIAAFFATAPGPQEILGFHPSKATALRASELLELNRRGLVRLGIRKFMPDAFVVRCSDAQTISESKLMQTYAFIVQTSSDPNPTVVNNIYGACDDASASSENGKLAIAFDREADSLEQAIREAVDTLQKLSLDVTSVVLDTESLAVLH